MNSATVKAVVLILKHYGVASTIVGELVLNYCNVQRIRLDIEITVHNSNFQVADPGSHVDNYTKYNRHAPHVRATSWISPAQTDVIFPDFFRLGPLEETLVSSVKNQKAHTSKELLDMGPEDVASLPWPCLATLIKGLGRGFLDTSDDMAMVSAEQLVDGMDLDEGCVQRYLRESAAPVTALILGRIRGKRARIDYFSNNKITCFISDEEKVDNVRLIPGFG